MKPIWSGSISFSLVNIPVKLYSPSAGDKLSFDLLHGKDMSPIRYAKVCKIDGEEVAYEDIVKGYEYEKGSYVVMDKEDFAKADARKTSTIEVRSFVDEKEIDSIYYEKPYYLAPGANSGKTYALFREALIRAKKVAITTYVLRNREKPAVIKADGDVLVLNQMRYADDLRDYSELDLPQVEIEEEEIELALKLIAHLSGPYDPAAYKDTYKQELMRLIRDKVAGQNPVSRTQVPEPTDIKDLMAALKDSLAHVKS